MSKKPPHDPCVIERWNETKVPPAKTPRAIIDKLHAEIVRILQLPDVRERYATLGFEAGGITPEEFTAHAKAEIGRWRKIFAELGIKPQ